MATYMRVFEHTAENFAGDVAYYTLAFYLSDMTGFRSIFVPGVTVYEGDVMRSLREAAHFSTLVEIRKWLESVGADTNLVRMIRNML
jgi:hypothetical protein